MIDGRIYPLLQTLAAADLDWLAREVEDGIAAGHVVMADPEQLAVARELAGRRDQDKGFKPLGHSESMPDAPFTDEEQLDYAAKYVVRRLGDLLDDMDASLTNVARLLDTEVRPPPRALPGPIALVLSDGDTVAKVSPWELLAAKEGLKELRQAILAWRENPEIRGDLR